MDILPQGPESEGCWTSLAFGVPVMPRAGVMIHWAVTEDVKARRNTEAVKDLESISITNGWKYQQEIDCVERVFLECETEVVMDFGRDHGWAFIHERKRHSEYVRQAELDKEIFRNVSHGRQQAPVTGSYRTHADRPWAMTKGGTVIVLVCGAAATLHQSFSHPLILLTAEMICPWAAAEYLERLEFR
jgi:hypothetical protein